LWVLWQIEGAHSVPNPGNFLAGAASVRLLPHATNGNHEFVVRAGVDLNNNSILDHGAGGEVMREITVYVVKVDQLTVTEVGSGFSESINEQAPKTKDMWIAENDGHGDIGIDWLGVPQTYQAAANVL
jgi:hypothetical protein